MIKRIFDLIYPRRCVLCLTSVASDKNADMDLCDRCENDLSLIQYACYQCGIPLQQTEQNQLCGQCLQKKPFYDRVISLYHYQHPMIWLIQQMKFHNRIVFARLLAQLLTRHLIKHQISDFLAVPDAIIPVPLHYKRQFERGFNQAEELSRLISQALNCPLDSQLIERPVDSQQQSGLNAQQRKKNVKGIFRVKNKKRNNYQHVVIIDDVMSTGSTLNEVARVLKKSGISKVDVWVLARASHQ